MSFIALVPPIYFNVQQYGATGNGTADDTSAIQAAINAANNANGGIVFFPAGTYSVTSPLTLSTANVRLVGSGNGSVIQPTGAFSGAQIILLSANGTGVTDLKIAYSNTSTQGNPVANGIQVTAAQNVLVQNVSMAYVNGWTIQSTGNTTTSCKWTKFDNVFSTLCLQGIHVLGTASLQNAAHVITNCILDQVVTGDGYCIEDSQDIELSNIECNVSNGSGASIHIKGNTASIHLTNYVGGNDTPTSSGPAVLIESGTNGTPSNIELTNAIIETGSVGISITAGTIISIIGCRINNNATHGINIGASTDDIAIIGCSFNNNGATAGTGHYDLQSASTGNVVVSGCSFLTAIGTTAAHQVAAGANITAGIHSFHNNIFPNWPPFAGLPTYARSNLGYNPAGPLTAPTIGASPYTAPKLPYDAMVYVKGGTVSAISIAGTATGATAGTFRVPANEQIQVTYTAVPTWTWFGE